MKYLKIATHTYLYTPVNSESSSLLQSHNELSFAECAGLSRRLVSPAREPTTAREVEHLASLQVIKEAQIAENLTFGFSALETCFYPCADLSHVAWVQGVHARARRCNKILGPRDSHFGGSPFHRHRVRHAVSSPWLWSPAPWIPATGRPDPLHKPEA